jgi:hypothetical protein
MCRPVTLFCQESRIHPTAARFNPLKRLMVFSVGHAKPQ